MRELLQEARETILDMLSQNHEAVPELLRRIDAFLAAPQQEPVLWQHKNGKGITNHGDAVHVASLIENGWTPLYAAPVDAQKRIAELEQDLRVVNATNDRLRISWREDTETERKRAEAAERECVIRRNRELELEAALKAAQEVVDEQSEDEGLWFDAKTAPEAYLQQEMRRLHAAIDAARREGK